MYQEKLEGMGIDPMNEGFKYLNEAMEIYEPQARLMDVCKEIGKKHGVAALNVERAIHNCVSRVTNETSSYFIAQTKLADMDLVDKTELKTEEKIASVSFPTKAKSQSEVPVSIMQARPPAKPKPNFFRAKELIAVFNASSPKERASSELSHICQSAPKMVRWLLTEHQVAPEVLDMEFGWEEGTLSKFCAEEDSVPVENQLSMIDLERLLSYFGLAEFMFEFKDQCICMSQHIRRIPHLDDYDVTAKEQPQAQAFRLKKIRRGKRKEEGFENRFYVYFLTFDAIGKEGGIDLIVSSPFSRDTERRLLRCGRTYYLSRA